MKITFITTSNEFDLYSIYFELLLFIMLISLFTYNELKYLLTLVLYNETKNT